MRITLRAFIEETDNGRLYLRLAVPAYGKHVIVSPVWAGNRWAYWRQCGEPAYVDTLDKAVRAAIVDGVFEPVNEALTTPLTLEEAEKVAHLLRWQLAG
jgi:hypothetical protein